MSETTTGTSAGTETYLVEFRSTFMGQAIDPLVVILADDSPRGQSLAEATHGYLIRALGVDVAGRYTVAAIPDGHLRIAVSDGLVIEYALVRQVALAVQKAGLTS